MSLTAMNEIIGNAYYGYENNNISCVFSTDLSAAYDTVDTYLLLLKLEHYGIREGKLKLFESYLSDRYQFVEIDSVRSQVRRSSQSGTCQGSKLSGLFYNIYTNEIPLLHHLMHVPVYKVTSTLSTGAPHLTWLWLTCLYLVVILSCDS